LRALPATPQEAGRKPRPVFRVCSAAGSHIVCPRYASHQKVLSRLGNLIGPTAFQMVDLALPLGYHGGFGRVALVKSISPQGPDEARFAVQQFTQRLWDLDNDAPCGLAKPRRRFQGRASTRLTMSRRFGRTKREED
jgi:hypothetical protein